MWNHSDPNFFTFIRKVPVIALVLTISLRAIPGNAIQCITFVWTSCTLENDRVHEDIHHLIAPLEKISKLDVTAIGPLIEVLKNDLEELKLGSAALRSVLMSLRLLRRLMKKNEGCQGLHPTSASSNSVFI